ncbi:hypothetical protein JKA74_07370 [Marivirga sp. S37H4]|uniref:Gingipain domain-containing protein n=1 Tax=Marivirga aurantiaca TaxID=2802615 RepID=A0A935C782_9BACT|nr:C25 family cysteine peptidase [Marivirga aurantiaca]MBK6264851.1 hypothetical protein [Marivirga aurantiaca]
MLKSNLFLIIGFFICWFAPLMGISQYGSEWINFNQDYYKISIAQEGAYQLDYNTLFNAGLPLSSIDSRTFRIYHRGNEIAIRVTGQADGKLNQGDVIQFLGRKNDGISDTPLYENPEDQPHTYYNLFTDTTAYFLTWRLDGVQGKRMIERNVINNANDLPAETSFIQNVKNLWVSSANGGQSYNPQNEVFKSTFDKGEGWTDSGFTSARNYTVGNLLKQNRNDASPEFEILVQGRNARDHQAEVFVGPTTNSLRSVGAVNFSGYGFTKLAVSLNWSDVNVNGNIEVRVVPQGNSPDRMSVSYISLNYSKTFDMDNEAGTSFHLGDNAANNSYVSFTNTNSSARLYRIDNFNEPVLLGTNRSGNEINTVVENTLNGANLYIQNQNFITPVIKRIKFRNLASIDPDYVIISHTDLTKQAGDYNNPVKSYASYRASQAGGGYDTLVVDITNLYDQFNFGEISPMAIYRFTRFLVENKKTEFVFLIGKGLNWGHGYYRQTSQTSAQYKEFVPTAGSPGSDNLFGFNLNNNNEASLSFGRLNAHNPQIVANYLNKIKEMEANPLDNLRRKKFLHLSGGLSAFEINRFKNYINDFTAFAESPYIGGDAINITKETTQVVELINVADEVNNGLGLITFFGHSSTGESDIDIGFVSNDIYGYQNKGKYPFILINGCNAGSFYQQNKEAITFGEDWVNTVDRGALGVMAHSALGFTNELKRYSDIFYEKAFGDSSLIDQPIGKIHKEVIKDYLALFGTNPAEIYVAQAQQFNLMGDPAYRLFPANKPDLEVKDEDLEVVSIDGEPIDAFTPEFGIDVIIRNFGTTPVDSIGISVKRILPNNEVIEQEVQYFPSVYYQDTVQLSIFNEDINSFGQNRFEIQLDPADSINEMDETNNSASIEYFISIGTTLNLYPYNFSFVNEQNITLTAQSTDLFSEERDFLFELDTSRNFTSPFLKQQTVNAKVIAKWEVGLLSNDNKAYFWRTKFADPRADELDQWTTSSFVYTGTPQQGWVQNQIDQIRLNEIEGLNIEYGPWSFEENPFQLEVSNPADTALGRLSIMIDGIEFSTFGFFVNECKFRTLNLVAFDRSSGAPYRILGSNEFDIIDDISCGRRPQVINQIYNNQLNQPQTYFKKYYDDLPEGDFVLITSYDSVAWNILLANNRLELLSLGASAAVIDNLQNGDPYILLGKKGSGAGNGIEITANPSSPDPKNKQVISLSETVDARYESGTIFTQQVGPVKSWMNLDADFGEVEGNDNIRVDVFGVDTLGNQNLLFSDADLPLDISNIEADLFPYLRLRATISDPIDLTAAKLLEWKVNFAEVPEGVLLPRKNFNEAKGIVSEGEVYELTYDFVNVTPNSFEDSIVYQTQLFNKNTRTFHRVYDTIPPLEAYLESELTSAIETRGRTGKNDISILVNRNQRFSEKNFSNNILNYREVLDVKKDSLPPFLSVTFDGISILDGDIVSPTPAIRMELKDENQLITKQDTSGIQIELQRICEGCEVQRIAFSNPRVEWIPATDEKPFSIQYQPESLEDGMYQLRVQASDGSQNETGTEPYKIRFEVINASTITNFYPYPNPFSTQTRFVFTLTGSEIPNEIKIQVLTVTGRVVREILQDEIGPIHIGNNITTYAWDGRDEFGDLLANGVYLYRVLVRNNGAFMEQRATSADKAFKKGYGKLYILR